MHIVDQNVIDYLHNLQPYFDGVLGEIQQEALLAELPIISPETARFLATLISTIKPKNVLEIGCCVGFSAGLIHRYMPKGGHITTIDRYDVMIAQAKKNFKRLHIEQDVTLLEGHATDILPQLTDTYDFIFLDAAKGQYLSMLPDSIRLLKIGGVLIADDVLQNGRITSPRSEIPRRQRTIHARMKKFLHTITHTIGLESSLIPIGDGLLFVNKLQDVEEFL